MIPFVKRYYLTKVVLYSKGGFESFEGPFVPRDSSEEEKSSRDKENTLSLV